MPRFSDRTIDQIKQRLTISDVMQNYAFIENRGGNKWVKCPFHGGGNERTPSCKLDDTKGTFYCFGCHESGDIFALIMKKEGLDFSSAVETLAKKAGVELEESNGNYNKDEAAKLRAEKDSMYDLYQRISGTFHYLLLNSPEAEDARQYLAKRNVSAEMIETFQLGYAPKNHQFLYSFLRKKDYSAEFLNKSGLFSQKREGWPLFCNRLMFPIRDRQGRVLAFSGRDLSGDDKAPKYINSPETRIYQKKENFFGLFEAKKTIASGALDPILCEGNFDVVSMHQAGYTSAVASLGTSFTYEQCQNMKKWFPVVKGFNLLFDSDEAGQNSTERALLIINSNGLEQKVHRFSTAKDASELLERGGKEAVQSEYEPYVTGFDYLVQKNLTRYDIKNARGKSDFVKSLSEYLAGCHSEVERDSYILTVSSRLGLSEQAIKEDLKNSSKGMPAGHNQTEPEMEEYKERPRNRSLTIDLFAMLYLVNHRNLFRQYRARISFGDLEDSDAQELYMAIENAMRDGIESNELFLTYLSDSGLREIVATSFALEEYSNLKVSALDEAIDRIRLRAYEKRREILTNQLRLATGMDADDAAETLDRKLELDVQIAKLKERLSSINTTNSEE